ncbi:glycosyltransferase [Timonella senegalensis]|uniref:glycosyltransferase n=1 Tax=Timonella senegalensis TaxID=1465825 RepID=UPI0028B085FB|nr:glycosyltransferase [Timonella senegalensis]
MSKIKVLHVATLLSPTGEFGGPVRVAMNQMNYLVGAGYDIEFCATTRGNPDLQKSVQGAKFTTRPAKTLGVRFGFSGTHSFSLYVDAWKSLRGASLVHLHLGRDLVTAPIGLLALLMRKKIFVQTHGMITPDSRRVSKLFDFLFTNPILRGSTNVAYLTEVERDQLRVLGVPEWKLVGLRNGVPLSPSVSEPRGEVPDHPEVLFLARLHERKRPVLFVEVAGSMRDSMKVSPKFSLVGPDEGEGAAVESAIERLQLDNVVHWEGPLEPERIADRMKESAVYVLPSVDEPFGMTVLEAASVGVPVVVTESCGLAGDVRSFDAGKVAADNSTSIANAIQEVLTISSRYRELSAGALQLARHYSMSQVGSKLEQYYENLLKED